MGRPANAYQIRETSKYKTKLSAVVINSFHLEISRCMMLTQTSIGALHIMDSDADSSYFSTCRSDCYSVTAPEGVCIDESI